MGSSKFPFVSHNLDRLVYMANVKAAVQAAERASTTIRCTICWHVERDNGGGVPCLTALNIRSSVIVLDCPFGTVGWSVKEVLIAVCILPAGLLQAQRDKNERMHQAIRLLTF
jgi:hypothetical protein